MLIDETQIVNLIKEHYQIIYLYCLSYLKSEADAKDVTQDVFVLMMEKAKELNDDNLRSWLFEVASRKTKAKFRELKKYSGCVQFDDDTCDIPDCVNDVYFFDKEDELDDDEILEMKDEVIDKLNPKEQKIYDYVYVQKMHYAQVGEKMGMTEKAVNVKVFRMKNKIKKLAKEALTGLILLLISFTL